MAANNETVTTRTVELKNLKDPKTPPILPIILRHLKGVDYSTWITTKDLAQKYMEADATLHQVRSEHDLSGLTPKLIGKFGNDPQQIRTFLNTLVMSEFNKINPAVQTEIIKIINNEDSEKIQSAIIEGNALINRINRNLETMTPAAIAFRRNNRIAIARVCLDTEEFEVWKSNPDAPFPPNTINKIYTYVPVYRDSDRHIISAMRFINLPQMSDENKDLLHKITPRQYTEAAEAQQGRIDPIKGDYGVDAFVRNILKLGDPATRALALQLHWIKEAEKTHDTNNTIYEIEKQLKSNQRRGPLNTD